MFKSFLVSICILLVLGTALVFYTKQKQNLEIQQKPVVEQTNSEPKTENKVIPQETFTNYKDALEASKIQDKPIFLFFEADWCVFCKKMKNNVLDSNEVKSKLQKDYVICFIDISSDKQITKNFKVKTIPTCLVISSDETVLARSAGLKGKEEFLNWLSPKEVSFTE